MLIRCNPVQHSTMLDQAKANSLQLEGADLPKPAFRSHNCESDPRVTLESGKVDALITLQLVQLNCRGGFLSVFLSQAFLQGELQRLTVRASLQLSSNGRDSFISVRSCSWSSYRIVFGNFTTFSLFVFQT